MIKRILSLVFLLSALFSSAQEANAPQMADTFRSDGKIYVVIIVIGMIFLALVIFLVLLERKISSLEKQINKD